MEVETRDFGKITVDKEDIVRFQSPIYGFEELKDFICLFEEGEGHIVWLQSLEDPDVCFVMVDPAVVDEKYHPDLPIDIQHMLGEGDCLFWLIIVVEEDFEHSTVNMKSPIVMNPVTRLAAQIILEGDYPIRRSLAPAGRGRQ